MAITATLLLLLLMFLYLYLCYRRRRQCCKTPLFIDWPIIGMLPQLLWNLSWLHDFITEKLKQNGGTGEFNGLWFTNVNFIVSSDPINVHHIMSKSFHNYVKGPEFRQIFQAFGDGIFTSDSDTWKYSRSLFQSLFKQKSFDLFLQKIIHNKVSKSLLPILDHAAANANANDEQGSSSSVLDLQDIFNRFTFDNICSIILGYDPCCLSIDFPQVEYEKAFNDVEESIFYRHVVPKIVWKLQQWLQIGQEKKMTKACKIFDQFLYTCIRTKREELSRRPNKKKSSKNNNNERRSIEEEEEDDDDDDQVDFLTSLIREERGKVEHDDMFLRDAAFNLFVAGRDTITSALTWFFWLVATNPAVETKILEEIKDNFGDNNKDVLGTEEVKRLVYLHGALCESLRLFPPIPFERKQAIAADTLPSGHHINPNTIILFSLYSMGRFEEIWGKDCLEFKPERWISDRGGIVYAPSYKFISFNAGPRICLGKELSFIQMKMVAAFILCNYRLQLVEGHPVIPSLSIVLLMKHGFKVRITKR